MRGPYNLSITLSYRCPIECRNCIVNGNMAYKSFLSEENIKKIIDMASKIDAIKAITYTGGEPFLMFQILLESIRYAKYMYNLPSACITNAFWASTYKKSYKTLRYLNKLGLKAITISSDKFHQEFIPFKNVVNAVTAAREVGLICSIRHTFTVSESTPEWLKKIAKHGIKPEFLEMSVRNVDLHSYSSKKNKKIIIESQPCHPSGRAKQKVPLSDIPFQNIKSETFRETCKSAFKIATIDVDGSIFLCCGGDFKTPILKVGNIYEVSLAEAINKGQYHPILNALSVHGVRSLFEALRNSGLPLPQKAVDPCQLCRQIVSNPQNASALRNFFVKNRVKFFIERLIHEEEFSGREPYEKKNREKTI